MSKGDKKKYLIKDSVEQKTEKKVFNKFSISRNYIFAIKKEKLFIKNTLN